MITELEQQARIRKWEPEEVEIAAKLAEAIIAEEERIRTRKLRALTEEQKSALEIYHTLTLKEQKYLKELGPIKRKKFFTYINQFNSAERLFLKSIRRQVPDLEKKLTKREYEQYKGLIVEKPDAEQISEYDQVLFDIAAKLTKGQITLMTKLRLEGEVLGYERVPYRAITGEIFPAWKGKKPLYTPALNTFRMWRVYKRVTGTGVYSMHATDPTVIAVWIDGMIEVGLASEIYARLLKNIVGKPRKKLITDTEKRLERFKKRVEKERERKEEWMARKRRGL